MTMLDFAVLMFVVLALAVIRHLLSSACSDE